MSKKRTIVLKEGAGCTVNPNEIINRLREETIESDQRNMFLERVIYDKNVQIGKIQGNMERFEKTAQHMQTQMVMSHLQERTDLVARLMRIDQRLAVLGVTSPNSPDAFTLAVNGLPNS